MVTKEGRLMRRLALFCKVAWLCLVVLVGTLALAPESLAQWKPEGPNKPAPDFDVRGPMFNAQPMPPVVGLVPSATDRAVLALRDRIPDLTIRWSTLTGAPSRIHSTTTPLTETSALPARQVAETFVTENLTLLKLTAEDLIGLRVSRDYVTAHNGVTHLTFQQQVNGKDVFGATINVNVDREGRVLNLSGEPMQLWFAGAALQSPPLPDTSAISLSAESAGVTAQVASRSDGLVYFPMSGGELRLAWKVTVEDSLSPNIYESLVDASDGTVLHRRNLTHYSHIPAHGQIFTEDGPIDFNPNGGPNTILPRVDASFTGIGFFPHNDPHFDWWNGSGQADRTTTISNNVTAQEDRDGNNTGGFRPTAAAGENFNFALDLTMDPSNSQSAAIVNLFYWNNLLHDKLYRIGFDEASGNFQVGNFGLGGSGGDPVIADAQDNRAGMTPSLCNANFGTPADGTSPRMQMFQCDNTSPERDGDFDNGVIAHEYGHGVHSRLVNTTGFQAGNEGWSDYFALSLLGDPTDNIEANHSIGNWLFGGGIRRQPYSTNQAIFTRTYADITDGAVCASGTCSNNPAMLCTQDAQCGMGNTCNFLACQFDFQCVPPATALNQGVCSPEIHNTGELWAETLWLARANLVRKLGGAIGGVTMDQLVIDGMKLSPASPDFLDGRDAILQADMANNGGAHQCLIWDAFASMGMGFSALSLGAADINPLEAFDTPSVCTPNIDVSGPIAFEDVCTGDTGTNQLEVFNTGTGDLIVTSVARSSGSTLITVDPIPTTPVVIAPGAHVDFTIHCDPTSPGSRTAVIRILSNDPDQPQIDLTYMCDTPAPDIDTNIANTGSFGDVCRDEFRDLTLTVSNSGGCRLTVTNITSNDAEFQVPSTMSFPVVIDAGDTLAVPIRLAPTSLGAKSGTITISSNDPDTPSKQVMVSGNAPPGDVRVTGSTDFGDVCGGTLAEKTLSVCNVGKCNLNVTSVMFNPPCADFTLVNNPFPAPVSPDSCQDVVIRFTPTSAGPKSCTLEIITDDPETPVITKTVTANTPEAMIDVPPDQSFAPTVIQSIGACTTGNPFPVSNTGTCNLTITEFAITTNPAEYSIAGLPSFPIILQPGHIAGEGDLANVFAPGVLDRDREGTVRVTYVSDPIMGTTTSVTRSLCGEGVRTGARVLVTAGGVPLATVEQIHLHRLTANRNKNLLDSLDNARNLALQTVTPAAPCGAFQYHREYGTESNPIQLSTGSYSLTVTARIGGKTKKKTVGFNVDTCDFNPTITVNF